MGHGSSNVFATALQFVGGAMPWGSGRVQCIWIRNLLRIGTRGRKQGLQTSIKLNLNSFLCSSMRITHAELIDSALSWCFRNKVVPQEISFHIATGCWVRIWRIYDNLVIVRAILTHPQQRRERCHGNMQSRRKVNHSLPKPCILNLAASQHWNCCSAKPCSIFAATMRPSSKG